MVVRGVINIVLHDSINWRHEPGMHCNFNEQQVGLVLATIKTTGNLYHDVLLLTSSEIGWASEFYFRHI